ncbi:MAG: VaFE repeat-containing surface-anchored protein [Eubacterium sp.]|nr:VaFE repeat-containing surface-anchored protein [Eubacterium sp.]
MRKKKLTRILSSVLALSMVVSLAAVKSFADETVPEENVLAIETEADVTEDIAEDTIVVSDEAVTDVADETEVSVEDTEDVSNNADTETPEEDTQEEEEPYNVLVTVVKTGNGLFGTAQGKVDAYVASTYSFEDKAEYDCRTAINNANLNKLIYAAYADIDNKAVYAKSMAEAGKYIESIYNNVAADVSIPDVEVPNSMKVYLLDDSRTPQRYDGMYYDFGGSVKDAKEAVKAAEEDNEGEANTDTDAQVADDSDDDDSDDDGEADQQDGEDGLIDEDSQIMLLPADPFGFDSLSAASTTNWVTYKNWRENSDYYEVINSIQYLYMSSLTGNAAICTNNKVNGANPHAMGVTQGTDATPAAYDVTSSEVTDAKYKRLFYYAYKNNYFYNVTPGTANTVTGNADLQTRARKETNLHIAICLLNGSLSSSDPLYTGLSDGNKADVQKLMNVFNGTGEYANAPTNITVYLLTPSTLNTEYYQSFMTFVPGKNYVAVQKQDAISGQTVNGAVADIYGSNTAATSGGTKIGSLNLNPTGILEVTDYVDTYKYFYAVETTAPPNYVLNDTPVALTVTDNDSPTANEIAIIKDSPITKLTVTKKSADTSCSDGNPNYSLDGTVYGMYKGSTLLHRFYINAEGKVYKVDNTLTDSVEIQSALNKAANGDYIDTDVTFREIAVGKGYTMDHDPHPYTLKANTTDLQVVELENEPDTDPFYIRFIKKVKDGEEEIALANAEFTIKYYPVDTKTNYTYDDLIAMTPAETTVIKTQRQADDKIWARLEKDYPYGFITVEETGAPTGYSDKPVAITMQYGEGKISVPVKLAIALQYKGSAETGYEKDGVWAVKEDGSRQKITAMLTSENNPLIISADDSPLRGDLKLEKVDENGDPLAGVKFSIYNRLTGEEVTVVTDENGKFSTESTYALHSNNTNAGTAKCGTWFKKTRQSGTQNKIDDTVGALPTGNYTVTEVDANGKQLAEPETKEVKAGETTVFFDSGRTDGEQKFTDMPKPELKTRAFVKTANGEYKTLPAKPGQTVTDTCDIKYIKAGETYTLIGKLMLIDEEGKVTEFATGRKTFTTPSEYKKSLYECETTQTVEFTNLDLTNFKGKTFVVYERLYLGDVTEQNVKDGRFDTSYGNNNTVVEFPLIHEDKNDKDQTVKVPDGGTELTDEDGTKTVKNYGIVRLKDRIQYKNLEVGKTYEVTGYLYRKPENPKSSYTAAELEALKLIGSDGKPITAKETFTAKTENGYVDVWFTYDASNIKKSTSETNTYVAFEEVRPEGDDFEIFSHSDINDEPQTVYEPEIKTTAKSISGRTEMLATEGKFIDTVAYSNVAPGSYTIKGIIYDKSTGKPLEINGKKLEASAELVISGTKPQNGKKDVVFTVPKDMQKQLEGKSIVCFEQLINAKGVVKAKHEDIKDKDQELTIPRIRTKLRDGSTKTQVIYPNEIITLVDTCSYENLIPGKKYTLQGELMNKNTGEKFLDEKGNPIKSEPVEFTASETGAGIVEVKFTFNAKVIKVQGIKIVAFEYCYPQYDSVPVATHCDIDDIEQTVYGPEVKTKVQGSRSYSQKDTVKLTDTVSYSHLKVGYTYVFKGWIVDPNGNPIKVDGKEMRAEKEFVPTTEDGTVDMMFPEFAAKDLLGKYIVFEEVYVKTADGELKLVGEHKDLKDDNQTFSVKKETPPGPPTTGDNTPMAIAIILMSLAAMAIALIIMLKNKNRIELNNKH